MKRKIMLNLKLCSLNYGIVHYCLAGKIINGAVARKFLYRELLLSETDFLEVRWLLYFFVLFGIYFVKPEPLKKMGRTYGFQV